MEILTCHVLCVGGGGAGITAAITAAEQGVDVILASKEPLGYGDTKASMGMMVCPGIEKDDGPGNFYRDMIEGGELLNDARLAHMMAEQATEALQVLEGYGHLFLRDDEGKLSSKVVYATGGHSRRRTIGCPPGGGIAIGNSLRGAVARAGVKVLEEIVVASLLMNESRVTGAVCYDLPRGEVLLIQAGAVVLATGGGGWLYYPHSDCTPGTTGDGFSLAYEAGAELVDMEQVQFIPFGLTHPSAMCGVFVGEPNLAAPAGVLRNRNGEIILENISTMTRAAVTRVMAKELSRGGGTEHGGLLLDLRPNLTSEKGRQLWEVRRKRGQMEVVRLAYGDAAYRWEEPWDVAPTAHYFMGGIKIDHRGRSTAPGLYAAGQVVGGIHGGNRLGSVSLAELFVFGQAAARSAVNDCKGVRFSGFKHADCRREEVELLHSLPGKKGGIPPLRLQRAMQQVMWDKVGLARDKKGLVQALSEIKRIEEAWPQVAVSEQKNYNQEALHAIELRHMLVTAKMVIRSALLREETRGGHLRLDFPGRDDENWCRNIILHKGNGGLEARTEVVRH